MGVLAPDVVRIGSALALVASVSACAVQVPPSSVSLGRGRPAVEAAAPRPPVMPSASAAGGPVTLAEALARALASHPLLSARQFEVRAREADAAQASRPPNPSVSAEVEDLGSTAGSGMPSQTTISIAQRFELGDKRTLRTGLAALERDSAEWDLALLRADVEGRVVSAFVAVAIADAQLALARLDADTATEFASSVRARLDAGVAAPPESDRADAAAASARIAVIRVVDTRRAAVVALASTWGSDAPDDLTVVGALGSPLNVPPFSVFDSQLTVSPAMARWVTELARRNQAAALARAQRVPDLDVGAGYRRLHEIDEHALVIGATVVLPWFDRRTDAVNAAQLRAEAAKAEAASALVAARELLATAHSAATSAAAALAELDQRVIPLSERAYDATLEGYRAGRFPLVDVLDARRALTNARRDRVQALGELQQSLVTLQRLVGVTPAVAGTAQPGDAR
jgi:outer membrane protein, heavy metal efflux system